MRSYGQTQKAETKIKKPAKERKTAGGAKAKETKPKDTEAGDSNGEAGS